MFIIMNLFFKAQTLENYNKTTRKLQKEYEEILSNRFDNNTIALLDSITTVMVHLKKHISIVSFNIVQFLNLELILELF